MKGFKKLMALLMAIVMVVSVMATTAVTASAETDQWIGLGTTTVDITYEGEYKYFAFIPEVSAEYSFYSEASVDTYGYLYDANMIQIASNDDGGVNTNFKINHYLEAGVKYYFGARFYDGDNIGSFNVVLEVKPHITNIEFPAVEVIENTNGYFYNETNTTYNYAYWYEAISSVNVTRSNGKVYKYSVDYGGGDYFYLYSEDDASIYCEFTAIQDENNVWTTGNTYVVNVNAQGFEKQVPVTIKPTPVANITFEPVNIIEGTQCWENTYWDENGQEHEFYCYNWLDDGFNFTVKFKDGTEYKGEDESGFTYDGVYYNFNSLNDNQNFEKRWLPGNTYNPKITALGYTTNVQVNILPTPIASIQVVPLALKENIDGSYEYEEVLIGEDQWDEVRYYKYNWKNSDRLSYVVTMKDGSQIASEDGYIKYNEEYYSFFKTEDNQGANSQWVAGNTYFATFTIMNYTATVPVSVLPVVVGEYDGMTYHDFNGQIEIIDCVTDKKGALEIPSMLAGKPVTRIEARAFENCDKLTSVAIPNTVNYIGDNAFYSCESLKNVYIPEGVTKIKSETFAYCNKLTNVNIPSTIKEIETAAFRNCDRLVNLVLPAGLEEIGESAFNDCDKLVSIAFPASLKVIGYSAFSSCDKLANVTLPAAIEEIGSNAFSNIESITSAYIPATVKELGTKVFSNKNFVGFNVDSNNAEYASIDGVLFSKDLTELLDYPYGKNNTSYSIPEFVKEIGYSAFSGNDKLTAITIPYGVKEIQSSAFSGCYNLTSLVIPYTVETIDSYAFSGCDNITYVILPKSVKVIDYETFSGCTSIANVFYTGTQQEFDKIKIYSGNNAIADANKQYNYQCQHTWIPATCTKAQHCIVCNATVGTTLAHNFVATVNKATQKANGSTVNTCSLCGASSVTPINKIATVKLAATKLAYNGKARKPAVTVKDAAGKKIAKKYYTVKYAKGRKNFGKYKVTVTFKGLYKGKKTLYFEIVSPASKVSKVTAAKKSLKITVKKVKKNADGYEIQYSLKKNFKSAKKVTLKKLSATSTTLKNLKAKKKYYVRVRTFKKVGKKTYYSAWSKAVSKKTKK